MRRATAAIGLTGVFAAFGLWALMTTGSGTIPPGVAPKTDAFQPQPITVTRGTIRSVLVLDGVIRPADLVDVAATAPATVSSINQSEGERVEDGETLMELAGSDGSIEVRSPVTGVVAHVFVAVGQSVAGGDVMATIAPERFEVQALVDPSLLYRLYEPPVEIRAQIDRGPAPFVCPLVSLEAELEGAGNPLDAPVSIVCKVPPGVRAFSGVRVRLAVTTGVASDTVVVPVEAVEGSADSGVVWVVQSDGSVAARSVKLGITDGVRVQVISGLVDGERILEFPPADRSSTPAAAPT
jgi:multidrug efflux pump subunit AcrA (membrane-fusion protein)